MTRAISLGSMPEPEEPKRVRRPREARHQSLAPIPQTHGTAFGGQTYTVTNSTIVTSGSYAPKPPLVYHQATQGPTDERIEQLRKMVTRMTAPDMFGREVTTDLLPHGRPLFEDGSTQCRSCNHAIWYDDLEDGLCVNCQGPGWA